MRQAGKSNHEVLSVLSRRGRETRAPKSRKSDFPLDIGHRFDKLEALKDRARVAGHVDLKG